MALRITSNGKVRFLGTGNPPLQIEVGGALWQVKTKVVDMSPAAGLTIASFFPAAALSLGISSRVILPVTTTGSPTAVNITEGANVYNVLTVTSNAIAVGTTAIMSSGSVTVPKQFNAAGTLTITFTGGASPAITVGILRIVLFYADISAPTI